MSEERKTKTDAAAPASAALGRIDRKDAFLQALHTFLTAHQGTEWAVAAVDIQHFKLYNELYGTEKGDALLETVANCLLGYSRQTGYPVGYFGNDDFFLCLPDEKAEQTAVLATLQACMAAGRQDVTFFMVMGVCPVQANPGADAATLCNYAQIAGVTTDLRRSEAHRRPGSWCLRLRHRRPDLRAGRRRDQGPRLRRVR